MCAALIVPTLSMTASWLSRLGSWPRLCVSAAVGCSKCKIVKMLRARNAEKTAGSFSEQISNTFLRGN